MDGVKLPPISPPAAPPSAASSAHSGSSGAVVPLPPLPGGASPPPDAYYSVPSPLLPPHGDSVFLTATPDELFAGLEELTTAAEQTAATAGTDKRVRTGPWRAPPGAYRVGSFIRNTRLCIHHRGCSKCRQEGALLSQGREVSRTRDQPAHLGRGKGGPSRGGRSDSHSGYHRNHAGSSVRSRTPGKKCSSLCVHPASKGGRSSSRRGRQGGGRAPRYQRRDQSRDQRQGSPRGARGGGGQQTDGGHLLLPHGSDVNLPKDFNRLSIYHDHDFTQMTWEELMALLTTNFHQYKELSEEQVRQLEELKTEILEEIQAGRVKASDPRLKWKNREMMLTLQLTHLSRARDIYRALWEALSEHNAHMQRLPTLLQVRAFREVHSLNTDFLKSGCTLLRFTQVPGRLCGGISLYQACLALVIGRRWVLRVLERRLQRVSDQTQQTNAAINAVLAYKFQELPADRMRVSYLLTKLDGLTRWFEDVKLHMTGTVQALHDDLEARRQKQIEETIAAAMDGEVDGDGDWKHLYDFNRCLTGLVEDMAARNALLRRLIDETRSSARRKGRDDREWYTWLLQQRQGSAGQGQGDRLDISRTRWLPV